MLVEAFVLSFSKKTPIWIRQKMIERANLISFFIMLMNWLSNNIFRVCLCLHFPLSLYLSIYACIYHIPLWCIYHTQIYIWSSLMSNKKILGLFCLSCVSIHQLLLKLLNSHIITYNMLRRSNHWILFFCWSSNFTCEITNFSFQDRTKLESKGHH